jgi:ubiquitin carboxyl-terminal hydrolase L5
MNTLQSRWTTIESDPGVFTALIQQMGCKDVELTEFISLELEDFVNMAPCHGLIFLFKWISEQDDRIPLTSEETDPDLFFAKQIIHNACATQALLSLLLNSTATVDVGTSLKDFKEFTKEFDPKLKGESIGDSEMIRDVHNSFARPEPFAVESESASSSADDKEDVYHFIAYVPFKGYVYELDGLKAGPIRLAKIPEGSDDAEWLRQVCPHIRARVNRYANSEVYFNLMAMVRDRRVVYSEAVAKYQAEITTLQNQGLDTSIAMENLSRSKELLFEAQNIHNSWEEENARRKHNYIPFIVATLKLLTKQKKMKGLIRTAQEKELSKNNTKQ